MIEAAFLYGMLVLAVAGGVGMVALRHPIHCAVSLLGTMLCLAGAYALLDAHLMAAFQVIIYAGAIMVLIVYILMLLDLGSDDARSFRSPKLFLGVPLGVAAAALAVRAAVGGGRPGILASLGDPVAPPVPAEYGTVAQIGGQLLGPYVLPFEVTSILLLAGIVGAVYLTGRDSAGLKLAEGAGSAGGQPAGGGPDGGTRDGGKEEAA